MQASASRSFQLKSVIAATALLLAGHAVAGTFMGEAGLAYGNGGQIANGGSGGRHDLVLDAAFGYRFDTNLGVRALFLSDTDPFRGLFATDRSFDDFFGVQATAYLPLAPHVNFMGGLGIGQTSLNMGGDGQRHQSVGDGVVSAGLQYQFARHYAMELHADYLTHTGESMVGLQFQVPF
jgi:hypothetical protein